MGKTLQEALTEKFVKLLKSKDPEKAARIIKKEYFATGPDKKDPMKSAMDFKKKYGYTLKMANKLDGENEQAQHRMEHAEACFDAMAETAKEGAMRQVLMDKLIAKQLKSAKVKLQQNQKVEKFRCLFDMMHLGNTPEAKLHNEKVVSLMLLNQGLITPEKYKMLRTNQLRKANRADNRLVEEEAADPKKSFLDLIRQEVASLQENAKYAKQGASDILNVDQNDPERLKKAFRAITDSHRDLLTTGLNLYEMKAYNWKDSATEDEIKWYKENLTNYGTRNVKKYGPIYGMANPFSAIMEPEEMLEYRSMKNINKIGNPKDENFDALNQYFVDIGETSNWKHELQKMENDKKFEDRIPDLGWPTARKKEYLQGFTVYRNGDDVLITKSEMCSLVPYTEKLRMAKPAEFATDKLMAELAEFREQYKERNTGRSSESYDAINNVLENVYWTSFSIPNQANCVGLLPIKEQLEELQKLTNAYLKHKEEDFRKRRIPEPEGGYKNHSSLAKNSYEKKRIELAESMLKFTKSKLKAIELTTKYEETVLARGMEDKLLRYPDLAVNKTDWHPMMRVEKEQMDEPEIRSSSMDESELDESQDNLINTNGRNKPNPAMRESEDDLINTNGNNKPNPAMRESENDLIDTGNGMKESDDLNSYEKTGPDPTSNGKKTLTNFTELKDEQTKERVSLSDNNLVIGKFSEKKVHNNNPVINNDNIERKNSFVKGN